MILKQCITVGLIFISVLDVQAKTVGYWRFEPGAVNSDSSGNGLDLTQIGTRISGISRPPRGPGSMLPTIPLTGMPNNGVAFLNGMGRGISGLLRIMLYLISAGQDLRLRHS